MPPRIRTLKPEALQHRKIGQLSDRAFRLWVGCLTQADDEGRLVAEVAQLRVLIFGYQPKTGVNRVTRALWELVRSGLIRLYQEGRVQYAEFPLWQEHQKINRPSPSKLPPYQDKLQVPVGAFTEDSLRTHGAFTEDSLNSGATETHQLEGRSDPNGPSSQSKLPLYESLLRESEPAGTILAESYPGLIKSKARKTTTRISSSSGHRNVLQKTRRVGGMCANPTPRDSVLQTQAQEILDYVNQHTGRHYRSNGNLRFIMARLRDGATVAECRAVVRRQVRLWRGDPKLWPYARPETLFNPTKYASYAGQLTSRDQEDTP